MKAMGDIIQHGETAKARESFPLLHARTSYIKRRLITLGITQHEMAKAMGYDPSYLSRIINNKERVSELFASKLAKFLHTDVNSVVFYPILFH